MLGNQLVVWNQNPRGIGKKNQENFSINLKLSNRVPQFNNHRYYTIKKMKSMTETLTDEMAYYIPLNTWIKRRYIEENTLDFMTGIENDMEQLSKILGVDLVMMAIKPRKD